MTGLGGGRVFLLLHSLSKTLSSTSLGKKSESESDFLRFGGGGLSSLTFGSRIGFGFGWTLFRLRGGASLSMSGTSFVFFFLAIFCFFFFLGGEALFRFLFTPNMSSTFPVAERWFMVFIFCVRRSLWGLRVWLRVSCVSLYSESFQRVAEWIPSEFRCKLLGQFYSFEFRHVRICNVARGWSSIATFCKIDTSPLEVHLLFYPTVFLTSSQTFSRFCRWSVDDLFFCHFVVQECIHSKQNRKLYSVASSRSDVTFMQSVIREHFSLLKVFAEF